MEDKTLQLSARPSAQSRRVKRLTLDDMLCQQWGSVWWMLCMLFHNRNAKQSAAQPCFHFRRVIRLRCLLYHHRSTLALVAVTYGMPPSRPHRNLSLRDSALLPTAVSAGRGGLVPYSSPQSPATCYSPGPHCTLSLLWCYLPTPCCSLSTAEFRQVVLLLRPQRGGERSTGAQRIRSAADVTEGVEGGQRVASSLAKLWTDRSEK